MSFDSGEWEIIQATDTPKQSNGFDCGLFLCSNAHVIIKKIPFYAKPSEEGRLWVKYILSTAPSEVKFQSKTVRPVNRLNLAKMKLRSDSTV